MTEPQRIVVTGPSGFIGQHLVRALAQRGMEVVELGRRTNPHDLLHPPELDATTHVVHLAAKTSVVESWEQPVEYFEVNALGTARILELCRHGGASLTYIASYPYGIPVELPITEEHPLSAVNPYGFSKNTGEAMTRFYADHYDVNANVIRLFNAYGPGQPKHLVMPYILQQVLDPETPEVQVRDLRPRRDFLYIDDIVDAILRVTRQHPGEAFNLGSGVSYSVEHIILTMLRLAHVDKPYRATGDARKNEIPDVVADVSKIRQGIGWFPSTSLEAGLGRLIDDTRTNRSSDNNGNL